MHPIPPPASEFHPEAHADAIVREFGGSGTTVVVDMVRVPQTAYRMAQLLAQATGKLHFLGFEWEIVPGERHHRETENYLITTSREIALAHCGSFVWVSPLQDQAVAR